MKKNIIAILSAALLFGSCGIYNKYERPDVDTRGLVRDTVSLIDTLLVSDTANFANIPWRQVFTDPQLQELIQTALTNNVDMLNAALNVSTAEAQLTASRLAFLPSVAFAPTGTLASFDGSKASKTYSLPVSASWNVDLFGSLLNASRSAKMQLLTAKGTQVSIQTSLISGIANLYYTLLMLDKEVSICDELIELSEENVRMMELQFSLGKSNSTAVQSAKTTLMNLQVTREEYLRNIRTTENSLCLLLNEPGHTIARGTFDNQSLPSEFSTGFGIDLLRNRADLYVAEMNLAKCFYNVNAARSAFYPGINITGTGAFTNSAGSVIVNPGKWLLSAVGSLTQPIFQNGKLIANLRASKNSYEAALNTWQNTIYSAGNEVSNALSDYNSYDKQSKIQAEELVLLRKTVDDTKMLYQRSGATYLEVITALKGLASVEQAKVSNDLYKMQAVVSLYQALGGGAK